MSAVTADQWRAILAVLESGEHSFICHAAAEVAAAAGAMAWGDGLNSWLCRAVQDVLKADGVAIGGNGFESADEAKDGEAPAWIVALGANSYERRIEYVRRKIAKFD